MSEKLEQLKKEMLDAREAYKTFMENNSRELTEEEKKNEKLEQPMFVGVEQTESKMFSLTKDNVEEFRKLEQKMRDTYADYVREYKNLTK